MKNITGENRQLSEFILRNSFAGSYLIIHKKVNLLKEYLAKCRNEHQKINEELQSLLEKYHDDGKEPNPMAKSMSGLKTNMKLAMNDSDKTVAWLMTDGCNMGVKSLNKYLNEFKAADEKSKDIAKKLINLEQKLSEDIRQYL